MGGAWSRKPRRLSGHPPPYLEEVPISPNESCVSVISMVIESSSVESSNASTNTSLLPDITHHACDEPEEARNPHSTRARSRSTEVRIAAR